MNCRKTLTMIMAISLILGSCQIFAQTAEELFPKAIQLEEVKGELEKAIEVYQTIVTKFSANRPIAAEALLHIGLCYEKMGNQEAKKAYQEVIRNYGEQKEVVAEARERLSKLELPGRKPEEPERIKIKQIWKQPYTDFLGTVSSDGNFRTYTFWGEGDVAIHNLITGENQILTHEADLGDSTRFAMSPTISKNGKQIAYSWWNPYNTTDLRLIDVDNPSPQLLYRNQGEEVYPVAWLSDNELVAIRYISDTRVNQIVSINVLDKTVQVQKTLEKRHYPQLACSPNEKYIAYDFANENNGGNFDINILPMDGSSEISIIKHPANDRVLGWVPGRKEFLFLSDRSGSWDLWAITLDDAKPSGPAMRIYTDIGEVQPMGFTQNGYCYFGFVRRNFYTNIAPFDAEKGEIEVGSGKSLKGSNYGIMWSPDGQYLAYIKIEDRNADNPAQLIIQDLKTGEEQKLAYNTIRPIRTRWSPDGNSILVVGREKSKLQTKGYKGGIFLIDRKTGQTAEIIQLSDYEYNVPEDDAFPLSDCEWSSDGKSFYYLFFKDRLVKHDLETGEDKILYKHSRFERNVLQLSPDGKNLLFGLQYPGDEKSRLFTIPAEGGKEKEVCSSQEASYFETALWSPDGKYIYFTERPEGTNLWRIPAEGGKPQKVWHSENRAEIFSIHPDGDQIAFSIRERTTEVRVIENLVQELEKIYNISK